MKIEYEMGDFETYNHNGGFSNSEYLSDLWGYMTMRTLFIVTTVMVISLIWIMFHWFLIVELIFSDILIIAILQKKELLKAIDFQRRLKKVPKIIIDNAKSLYGENWRPAALECYEAHTAGECLLCGAE